MTRIDDAEIAAFAAKQNAFVLAERDAAFAQIRTIWAKPLDERVDKGYAIRDLKLSAVDVGQKGSVELVLEAPDDQSRFREGDVVRITVDGCPSDPLKILAEGRIVSTENGQVVVEAKRHNLTVGDSGLVIDMSHVDLTERYQRALNTLVATRRGCERIVPLLLGRIEPTIQRGIVDRNELLGESFNDQQIQAIEASAGTDLCHLVQGPPGTGKTKVLARLVLQLLKQKPNARIFVTSFTHRAIENALSSILKAGLPPEVLFKVGERALDPTLPRVANADALPKNRSAGPLVVGATPFALSSRLMGLEFDWVIVDEASQMTLPLAIMAMLVSDRWIFFGDDKQMPPVVQSMSSKEAVERSVFGLLRDGGYNVMLQTTYRLPPEIAAWPSKRFYDGRLKSGGAAVSRRLCLGQVPEGLKQILSPDACLVHVACLHRMSRAASPEEAKTAADIIYALASVGFPLEEVGVVVPYRRQARLIREQLLVRGLSYDQIRDMVVDTVERMQGQEREVVLVSMTTSSLEFANDLSDFLFMPERLNVAITRPRSKLIVLASPVWLTEFPDAMPAAKMFADFLRHCHRVDYSFAHG